MFCCESSDNIACIARQCIVDNELDDKITVIVCHSLDLKVGERKNDIPFKVDIIITELLGK